MAEFVAHIANCLMIGNKFENDGSSSIKFNLGQREIVITQRPEIAANFKNLSSLHGRTVNSTKVVVLNVDVNEIEDVRDLIFSLCFILSFITCSQVVFHSQEYPKSSSSWAIVGKTSIYHNVLDIRDGDAVADFIRTVWVKFISIEKNRRLDMIFDYIHHALYPGSTIESKLAFTFVTLESLKYTFAKAKGYPFIGGYFRKPNNKIYSFGYLLEQMFKEVGMIFKSKVEIEDLRNEIIHSGISKYDFNYNYKVFMETQNLIREYLIKLLGYSNFYKRV